MDVPGQDEEAEAPTIILTVTYPPTYPDIPPDLTITSPQNAPKYPYLTLPDDAPYLLSTLSDSISESLGQAMIFTLISTLKENTETLITERLSAVQAEEDKERAKAEEAENVKFHGEAVTRERFLEWRMRFREEQERLEEESKRVEEEGMGKKEIARSKEVKLTGKQLWDQGLVGKVEEEEEGGEEESHALMGVERLKVGE
ncbi:hypothetical protein OEA41_001214 [Lepraria neglecta]|uniref:RWD domain-containing protein n=1 Tax=Lepraria neglecta TaxID=209136 RepID=A0AAD9ZHF6_9LECA|nr:hypothetical protein OEA41_001214 [Lepraria neglecta]